MGCKHLVIVLLSKTSCETDFSRNFKAHPLLISLAGAMASLTLTVNCKLKELHSLSRQKSVHFPFHALTLSCQLALVSTSLKKKREREEPFEVSVS